MERLTGFKFEWILAGHGDRVKLPPEQMSNQIQQLVETMRSQ